MEMREIIFTGERAIENEEGKKYLLKYYITKDMCNVVISQPIFGVAVYKYDLTYCERFMEKEESMAISHSMTMVKKLVDHLITFKITPVCLLEVLDDLISQQLEDTGVI